MEKQELDLYKRLLIVMMVLVSMFIGGTYNDFYLALILLTILICIITMGFGLYMMHASIPNRSNKYRISIDTRYQLAKEEKDERFFFGKDGSTIWQKNKF